MNTGTVGTATSATDIFFMNLYSFKDNVLPLIWCLIGKNKSSTFDILIMCNVTHRGLNEYRDM